VPLGLGGKLWGPKKTKNQSERIFDLFRGLWAVGPKGGGLACVFFWWLATWTRPQAKPNFFTRGLAPKSRWGGGKRVRPGGLGGALELQVGLIARAGDCRDSEVQSWAKAFLGDPASDGGAKPSWAKAKTKGTPKGNLEGLPRGAGGTKNPSPPATREKRLGGYPDHRGEWGGFLCPNGGCPRQQMYEKKPGPKLPSEIDALDGKGRGNL